MEKENGEEEEREIMMLAEVREDIKEDIVDFEQGVVFLYKREKENETKNENFV